MRETLPVTVVTGFLGAGKTTLVNQWLARTRHGDIAVIVNEHGDIGIDGELLAQRARVLFELTGGCICCTSHAELIAALDSIATSATPPERILVETSGAASPAGVLRAVIAGGRSRSLLLDGVITVFDCTRVAAVLEQDLAREQLGYADIVVLSRADKCQPSEVANAKHTLARQNEAAVFVESAHGRVVEPALNSLEEVLALRHAGFVAPVPPLAGTHVYESIALELDGDVDAERFGDFVESDVAAFAGRIFRVKGILAVSGLELRMIVQGVADCVEVSFGQPWNAARRTSRLVVVGFGLDRSALTQAFSSCAASQ